MNKDYLAYIYRKLLFFFDLLYWNLYFVSSGIQVGIA
jgi:hypothetical protein